MNSGVGDAVIKIFGKELADKGPGIKKLGSKLLTGIIVAAPIISILAVALTVISFFNKFVILQQKVFTQASMIESEYQRRVDLVPKIIGIALEYSEHEKALFKYVADVRELKVFGENTQNSPGIVKKTQFEGSLSKLMALAEQYPNLKATQSYQDLMKKLEITEDRISSARGSYSKTVNIYNQTICSFPDNVFALMLRFDTFTPYHPKKDPMPLRNKRIFFPNKTPVAKAVGN